MEESMRRCETVMAHRQSGITSLTSANIIPIFWSTCAHQGPTTNSLLTDGAWKLGRAGMKARWRAGVRWCGIENGVVQLEGSNPIMATHFK